MSKVKLTHASGNSVSIAAPESNPASNRTLYVPSNADGTILTNTTPGCILQVLSTPKTDVFTTNSTSYVDVTGLSVAITPASTSSKILVVMNCVVGNDNGTALFVQLVRDSTAIHIGDAAGNRTRATSGTGDDPSNEFPYQLSATFLDSPSTTSATTYKVQMLTEPSGNTGYGHLNASGGDLDNNQHARYASSITVMEVSG